MARALTRLLLPVLAIAAACGTPRDDPAAGRRGDTTQQAATVTATPDTAQARQAVLGLEKELFQSYARGDTAPEQRILAEDYIGFTGNGNRETKAQALASLHHDTTTATAPTVDSIHVDSTTVRVYGDAAVAQASGTFQMRNRRQSTTVGFRNTDVYVWRDGQWQVVATHLSRVAEPQRTAHSG